MPNRAKITVEFESGFRCVLEAVDVAELLTLSSRPGVAIGSFSIRGEGRIVRTEHSSVPVLLPIPDCVKESSS